MRIRRSLATAAVLVAATAPLAACGSADSTTKASSSSSSSSSSGSAGSASSASPSSAVASDTGGPLSRAQFVEAITQGQIKAGSAHLAMSMTGTMSMTAQGEVSYKSAAPRMKMTMTMQQLAGRKIEMRLVDGIVYMSIPQLTPAGKFVKIDPKDTSNPLSKGFGSVTQQMDPLASARAMKASVRNVRFVGKEQVDGESADHYKVAVDTASMMTATKGQAAPGMPKTLNYDMWVDSKNLLRRMKFALSGIKMTMTMSKWGEPVSVQAPPVSQQVDASKLGAGAVSGS